MAELQDDGELGELEAVDLESKDTEQLEEKQEPDDDLEPKYRGKSVKEIAQMHREAEKLMARQSQEVGEVRKLADELIKSQLYVKPKEEKPEVDFFANPQEAIRQAVESNPDVVAAKQFAEVSKKELALGKLKATHPDYQDIVNDSGFVDWVKASPVRQRLIQQADAYDFDAANELLTTFKELKGVREKQVTEVDKTVRNQALKAASVSTGGSGESGKKVYRSAALILLKLRDPAKYAAMQDEIDAAYREDRVK